MNRRVIGGPKVKFADLADVEAQAKQWTPGQMDCRSGLYANHNWQPFTARRYRHKKSHLTRITVIQRCENCENTRQRDLTPTGRWIDDHWRPGYRPGYLMPPGKGRIGEEGKEALRMLSLRRLTITEGGDQDA